MLAQPQSAIRVGGGIRRAILDVNFVESYLLRPPADQRGNFRHFAAQDRQGQRFEAQTVVAQEVGRDHGVVVDHVSGIDAVVAEERQVVVGVVGDATDAAGGEQRPDGRQDFFKWQLLAGPVSHGYVPGGAVRYGKAEPGQLRSHGVSAAGLGVERK